MGASIDWPLAQGLLGCHAFWDCPSDWAQTCILSGGDDYELVFTAPAQARAQVQTAAMQTQTAVTRIGSIRQGTGLEVLDAQGQALKRQFHSFDHFATP